MEKSKWSPNTPCEHCGRKHKDLVGEWQTMLMLRDGRPIRYNHRWAKPTLDHDDSGPDACLEYHIKELAND